MTEKKDTPANPPVEPAEQPDHPLPHREQKKQATLTKEQPPNAVSEVLTGTPEHPESTRIVPPGEAPASTVDVRPAELRRAGDRDSQVAPTQVVGENPLHGNADY